MKLWPCFLLAGGCAAPAAVDDAAFAALGTAAGARLEIEAARVTAVATAVDLGELPRPARLVVDAVLPAAARTNLVVERVVGRGGAWFRAEARYPSDDRRSLAVAASGEVIERSHALTAAVIAGDAAIGRAISAAGTGPGTTSVAAVQASGAEWLRITAMLPSGIELVVDIDVDVDARVRRRRHSIRSAAPAPDG